MSRDSALTLLSVLGVVLLLLVTWRPELLSDKNEFFKEFVGQNFIAFMGVILTLSLGLLAQLSLSVAKLGEILDKEAVTEIRDELRSTARMLVMLFFASISIVFVKPLLPSTIVFEAALNSGVVLLVVYYLLILSDVVLSIFDFDI